MTNSDDWRNLAIAVRSRREALGLRQSDIPDVSVSTITKIEQGGGTSYRSSKLRALERALGWTPGTIDSILQGADNPDPDDDPPASGLVELRERIDAQQEQLDRIEQMQRDIMAAVSGNTRPASIESVEVLEDEISRAFDEHERNDT